MSFSSDNPMLANQIPISFEMPHPNHPNFRDITSLFFKRIVDSVNTKEGALYFPQEIATFQQYFSYSPATAARNAFQSRNVYRKVIDIIASSDPPMTSLPNTGTLTAKHGITFDSQCTLTRLYGAATDPTGLNYIALGHAAAPPNQIELYVNATDVFVVTGSNRSNYTRATVVIEWTKNL